MARKQNWSEEEIVALVESVVDRWAVIRGKFAPHLTQLRKSQAWQEVIDNVNAVSTEVRDLKSVKKKWVDLQSTTRKREVERRRVASQTGGGPAPFPLKSWEEKILSVVSSNVVVGISGGFESETSCNTSTNTATVEIPVVWDEDPICLPSEGAACPNVAPSTSSSLRKPTMPQRRPTPADRNEQSSRIIQLEEQKLELSRRKVVALEQIAMELAKLNERMSPGLHVDLPMDLSPNIKF